MHVSIVWGWRQTRCGEAPLFRILSGVFVSWVRRRKSVRRYLAESRPRELSLVDGHFLPPRLHPLPLAYLSLFLSLPLFLPALARACPVCLRPSACCAVNGKRLPTAGQLGTDRGCDDRSGGVVVAVLFCLTFAVFCHIFFCVCLIFLGCLS